MKRITNHKKLADKIAVLKPEPKCASLPGWSGQSADMVLLGMAKLGSEIEASGQTAEQALNSLVVKPIATLKGSDNALKLATIEAAIRMAHTCNKLKDDRSVPPEEFIAKVDELVKAGNDNVLDLMNEVVAIYGIQAD